MFTPETPAIQSQTTAGTGRSMRRLRRRSYRDLVPGDTSDEPPNITEPLRCGVMQYASRTYCARTGQCERDSSPSRCGRIPVVAADRAQQVAAPMSCP